jgi:hypothetical protein
MYVCGGFSLVSFLEDTFLHAYKHLYIISVQLTYGHTHILYIHVHIHVFIHYKYTYTHISVLILHIHISIDRCLIKVADADLENEWPSGF